MKLLAIVVTVVWTVIGFSAAAVTKTSSEPPIMTVTSQQVRHHRNLPNVHLIKALNILKHTKPLPINQGIKAPVVSSAPTTSAVPPVYSRGSLGPCVGITAAEPVIRCAAAWAGIDADAFLAIAQRESSLEWWVTSLHGTGCCHGLFQLHDGPNGWDAWLPKYTQISWFDGVWPSYFDPRANALVAAGIWRSQGGPCPAWCFG